MPGQSTADASSGKGAVKCTWKEFESQPGASTADASSRVPAVVRRTPLAFESQPEAPSADASARAAAVAAMPAADAQGTGGNATGSSAVPTAFRPPHRKGHTSNDELRGWMARLRGECQVLENSQVARMRDGYEVLEGGPELPAADVHSCAGDGSARSLAPSGGIAAAAGSAELAAAATTEPAAALAKAEAAECFSSPTFAERPLTVEQRDRYWASMLREELKGVKDEDDEALPRSLSRLLLGGIEKAPAAVGAVFDMAADDSDEDVSDDEGAERVLFDAAQVASNVDAPAALGQPRLAAAFAAKYFPWLSLPLAATDDRPLPIFRVLSQLLRYHCPAAAIAVESASAVATVGPLEGGIADVAQAARELSWALSVAVAGNSRSGKVGHSVCDTLLGGSDRDALLVFCDTVVADGHPALPLFAMVLLLAELAPEPGESLERLGARLRGAEGLGGVGAQGVQGVHRCLMGAKALLQATPVSLLIEALGGGMVGDQVPLPGRSPERSIMPSMCIVSPAEVLHHTYERPSSAWRLVVVDVRMRPGAWALPICVRLRQAQHAKRKQMLLDMPYEEQIHLCLMGDAPPAPGEDAYQLCKYLVGPKARRRHVSVVDGGWPAVEELTKTLHLDLLPLGDDAWTGLGEHEPVEHPSAASAAGDRAPERGPGDQGVAQKAAVIIVDQAAGLIEGVALATVNATETAKEVGQKVAENAKHVWARASGRALTFFDRGAQWLDRIGGSADDPAGSSVSSAATQIAAASNAVAAAAVASSSNTAAAGAQDGGPPMFRGSTETAAGGSQQRAEKVPAIAKAARDHVDPFLI